MSNEGPDPRLENIPAYIDRESLRSHIPILTACIEAFGHSRVLEFGCGRYSTLFFKDRGLEVSTVEDHPQWLAWAKGHTDYAFSSIDGVPTENVPSLVFIDGSKESRAPALRWAAKSQWVETIVYHDAEKPRSYGWPEMAPTGWTRTTFIHQKRFPHTEGKGTAVLRRDGPPPFSSVEGHHPGVVG